MKKATIIWVIAEVLISILFAANVISDTGWLGWSIVNTFVGVIIASK